MRLGRLLLRPAAYTSNNTSLGTVPNAATRRALGSLFFSLSATDEGPGVAGFQRRGQFHPPLARGSARLLQDIAKAQPVHREQHRVGVLPRVARRPRSRLAAGLPGEPLQLGVGACVAEDHLVPGA